MMRRLYETKSILDRNVHLLMDAELRVFIRCSFNGDSRKANHSHTAAFSDSSSNRYERAFCSTNECRDRN